MELNDKQSKSIYNFIMKYNSEVEFSKRIQELYNSKPWQLSILQIYALEEVLRYGTKEIYNKFLKIKGSITEEQAVNLFDDFIQLLNKDANFKEYKMNQLFNSPETLSELELFAFRLIEMPKAEKKQTHEKTDEKLEYTPFNPILFGRDSQIKETLENLFLGEFIHRMLESPTMQSIRDRQKEAGIIANRDKPFIIETIQERLFSDNYMELFEQVINKRYTKVKFDLLLGKGEEAFEEYLKFNTNISVNEILGIERDNNVDDMYDYLKDMIRKKQAMNGSFNYEDIIDMKKRMKEKVRTKR